MGAEKSLVPTVLVAPAIPEGIPDIIILDEGYLCGTKGHIKLKCMVKKNEEEEKKEDDEMGEKKNTITKPPPTPHKKYTM